MTKDLFQKARLNFQLMCSELGYFLWLQLLLVVKIFPIDTERINVIFFSTLLPPASGKAVVVGVMRSIPGLFSLICFARIGFSNPIARQLFIVCC